MEHNNTTATSTNLRQQQQQTRDQQLPQNLLDQQHLSQQQVNNSNNENQQQFCLRWHNHQTSLLSTLPILLDQSHLTDVTISAEGRTLRAHRVVLSACSSFFLEIFRTLESTHHPVIIIPGASFTSILALLTFMYSGEVNVYEEQIPMLLSLAETLGIKGLADVHNNLQKSSKSSNENESLECKKEVEKSQTPPSSPATPSSNANFSLPQTPISTSTRNLTPSSFNPLLNPSFNAKFPSPLENFFLKSLQFYPNLMHQPLNFSQTALNKTTELLAKYQQQCSLYQNNLGITPKDLMPPLINSEEETQLAKRFCSGLEKKSVISPQQLQQNQMIIQQQKDIKRIDKVVENLRVGGGNSVSGFINKHEKSQDNLASSPLSSHLHNPLTPLSIKTSLENYPSNTSPVLTTKSSLFSSPSNTETSAALHSQLAYNISPEDQLKLQQHLDKYAQSCARSMEAANENIKMEAARMMSSEKLTATGSTKAPSNSKLYATCFICHKQLSNQYNLRVHLETHQNVRYACNVCSHVSRSKDALRKHVSYRHPGAPSPCETEARRKRANKVLASQLNVANLAQNSVSSGEITPTSPNTPTHFPTTTSASTTITNNDLNNNENSSLTAAQITSAYQMFMPQQYNLTAAAVNAATQQQQQQPINPSCSSNQISNKDFNNSRILTPTSTHMHNTPNSSTEDTKFNLNDSPIPTASTNTTSSNNPNDLQQATDNKNNNTETRMSPNLQS